MPQEAASSTKTEGQVEDTFRPNLRPITDLQLMGDWCLRREVLLQIEMGVSGL